MSFNIIPDWAMRAGVQLLRLTNCFRVQTRNGSEFGRSCELRMMRRFQALKRRYREGIPKRSAAENQADAEVLYQFIRELGGEKLVGPSMNLAPGTFWKNVELNTAE